MKGITEQEPRPGPSGIKQPVKPKQSTQPVLFKKKDPLRIQKRVKQSYSIHTLFYLYCVQTPYSNEKLMFLIFKFKGMAESAKILHIVLGHVYGKI